MEDDVFNDGTDAFDARLAVLQRKRIPAAEIDAAIDVYERLKTAQTICQALLREGATDAAALAVLRELGAAAQRSQSSRSSE